MRDSAPQNGAPKFRRSKHDLRHVHFWARSQCGQAGAPNTNRSLRNHTQLLHARHWYAGARAVSKGRRARTRKPKKGKHRNSWYIVRFWGAWQFWGADGLMGELKYTRKQNVDFGAPTV